MQIFYLINSPIISGVFAGISVFSFWNSYYVSYNILWCFWWEALCEGGWFTEHELRPKMTVLFSMPRETDRNDRKFLIVYPYSEFYSQDLNIEKNKGWEICLELVRKIWIHLWVPNLCCISIQWIYWYLFLGRVLLYLLSFSVSLWSCTFFMCSFFTKKPRISKPKKPHI